MWYIETTIQVTALPRTEHHSLTHELGWSHPVDSDAVSGRDLLRESEVDEFDVEASSTLHDDVVRLNAEMHDAAMMQKLHRIQHLHTDEWMKPKCVLKPT